MSKDIKKKIFLSKDLYFYWLFFIFVFFGQFIDKVLSFFIYQKSVSLLFRIGRGYQKEFTYLWRGLNDKLDIFFSNGLILKVEKDGNRRVKVRLLINIQRGEYLLLFSELISFILVIKFWKLNIFQLIRDNISSGIHDFEYSFIDSKVSPWLFLAKFLELLSLVDHLILLHLLMLLFYKSIMHSSFKFQNK